MRGAVNKRRRVLWIIWFASITVAVAVMVAALVITA